MILLKAKVYKIFENYVLILFITLLQWSYIMYVYNVMLYQKVIDDGAMMAFDTLVKMFYNLH